MKYFHSDKTGTNTNSTIGMHHKALLQTPRCVKSLSRYKFQNCLKDVGAERISPWEFDKILSGLRSAYYKTNKRKKIMGHRTRFQNIVDWMKLENSIFHNYAHSLIGGVHVRYRIRIHIEQESNIFLRNQLHNYLPITFKFVGEEIPNAPCVDMSDVYLPHPLFYNVHHNFGQNKS